MYSARELLHAMGASLALAWFLLLSTAHAETLLRPMEVELKAGKSLVIESPAPVGRVSVANPDIADFVLLSPGEIYLTGKAFGVTNLTLWDQTGGSLAVYEVTVTPDTSVIKSMLHKVMPEEESIKVLPGREGAITLAGSVSSAANMTKAVSVARSFTEDPDLVVNVLQVGGVQQVMLEVVVAEVSRTDLKNMGVNLGLYTNGEFFYTTLSQLFSVTGSEGDMLETNVVGNGNFYGPQGVTYESSVNSLFRFNVNGATVSGFLDILKQDGHARVLAEPNLVCLSGQEADFLAGGEVPVPVPQGLGTVAIEYKPYGVGLKFTPMVLSGDNISLKVAPEVSELDYSNAVTVSGFLIPALTTRKAATTVELGDGETFVMAGLLSESTRQTVDKYPFVGDIPVLGSLFRSSNFQQAETELMILVTPHLVRPVDRRELALPTDNWTEPSDLEFYLLGQMEGSSQVTTVAHQGPAVPTPATSATGLEGDFGHTLPSEN